MTKKEQKLFNRVLWLNDGCTPIPDYIYKYNGMYYATNSYMSVRSTECPHDGEPLETNGWSFEHVEEMFRDGIFCSEPLSLPSKKDVVDERRNLTAKGKKTKPYVMNAGEMIFALNNEWLNWFLDVFDGGTFRGGSPVEPFYFKNKSGTIEGILCPIKVSEQLKAKYLSKNGKEHIL